MRDPYTMIGNWCGLTLWHRDKGGVDGACGWFMRASHGDPAVLKAIERRFSVEWDRTLTLPDGVISSMGLFDNTPNGWPAMSIHAVALNLFFWAALEHFRDRDRAVRFLKKNLFEILLFAENPCDSAHEGWLHKYGIDKNETRADRIHKAATMIYGWILRESRPWYRHPRWHISHWRLTAVVLFVLAAGVLPACNAQTMTVAGSHVQDAAGNPCASCRITFAPVDSSGRPISFRIGGGGQVQSNPVSANVTNGAFTIVLPDVSMTNPQNVCFKTTVVDRNTGVTVLGPAGYTCVQPSSTIGGWCTGSTCNFDAFVPNTPGLPLLVHLILTTIGSSGRATYDGTTLNIPNYQGGGGGGGFNWTGAWSGSTAYDEDDAVSYLGSSYVAIQAGTNHIPSSSPSFWSLVAQKGDTGTTGATGPTGSTGATGAAGTSFTWRNAWSGSTTYAVNDAVSFSGSSYVSIQAGTNQEPDTATSFWSLMAQKGSGGGGVTISGVTFTPTDAATIVAQWTTSSAADSFAYCGGQGAVDNGSQVGVTSPHEVIITGLIANSSYPCHVTSAGVNSAPQNVATLSPVTRTPILSASMGSVTTTAFIGDSTYNVCLVTGPCFMAMDDAASPGTSSSMMLTQITNESTLALSLVNGFSNYGMSGETNGTDGPAGVPLTYKQSGLLGMNGRLYMFEQRDEYSLGGSMPQTVYFGNVIADHGDQGATWANHQAPATFNANGSPDGPGVSMFSDSINQAWCSPVRGAMDDGTNGYLTPGNEIDGMNAYVFANCTDGNWNNSSHLWMVRVPRVSFGNLTAGNAWQWWAGPTSPTPADFVNPANWSYRSADKVAIYSAAGQASAADEIFIPGFNSYVLETWYQPTINDASTTTWKWLTGPTPAGPWTLFFTSTFNPSGWYNPSLLQRPIANNTSSASVTALALFSGNYQSPTLYYHPSFATMTLSSTPLSETVGSVPTPSSDFSAQFVGVYDTQFAFSGHLQTFTVQTFTASATPVQVGVCSTADSGAHFTITNSVTVTLAATTAQQTFSAPTNFTAIPVTAGEYPCFYMAGGGGLGKALVAGGLFFSNTSFSSAPAGSQPYTPATGSSIDLQETISIP